MYIYLNLFPLSLTGMLVNGRTPIITRGVLNPDNSAKWKVTSSSLFILRSNCSPEDGIWHVWHTRSKY